MQGARLFGRVPVAWWEGMRIAIALSRRPCVSIIKHTQVHTSYLPGRPTRCCVQASNVEHLASTPLPARHGPSPRGYFLAVCGERGKKPGEGEGSLHSHARNAVFPDLPQPSLPPPIFLARLCMFWGCLSGDFRYLQAQRRLASRSSSVSFDLGYRHTPGHDIRTRIRWMSL